MDYAIETIALTKTFADWWGRRKVYAVNDLTLQVNTNEVFGLLGPNGSGKTTTIKMLLGLLHPTRGHAFLLGGQGDDPKINARVGFLPEESYLYKYLTPRETLDFYGRLFGLPRAVRKDRIETLLDMVGLKAVANRQVGSFSKGMARRIGLAQALINDPDLLILDEPTTGLDPIGTRQIKDLIINLAKRGKTILLCSHLLADVEDVCDRIAIMYGGKVQAQGHVNELLEQADKRQITTGQISDQAMGQIRDILEREHAEFDLSSPMEKLETYFVRTVAEAQQQAQPTSGAESTTRMAGFLAGEEDAQKQVLSSLVQGQTKSEPKPSQAGTRTAKSAQSTEVEPKSAVLDSLIKKAPDQVTLETPKKSEDTAAPIQTKTQVNRGILDQLVDPGQQGDATTEKPRKGDSDHA
ncbi:MAG: ATP-binding cassette domain-containing protein [Phycisphaerae bacterium]|nr:ATP-binding cassette domain-containing protein [Phycisphaerae bacterium]